MAKPESGGDKGGGKGGGGTLFGGTGGDDLFSLAASDLKGATIDGGSGDDTLAIAGTGDLAFASRSYRELIGVDALDFSGWSGGTLDVTLDTSMVTQSDAGILTIVSGTDGIDRLEAPATGAGTVIVAGTGSVQLADNTDNAITLADGATVAVLGGIGNDTITASSTGSELDGGAGNDLLVAGNGADTIAFSAGHGADAIGNFDVTTDVVALTGLAATDFAGLMALVADDPSGAVLDLGNGDRLQFAGVAKSSLTADNFTLDGNPVPADTNIYVDASITAADLNSLIANAEAGATITLLDGTYHFDQTIVIARGDLTMKGQSETGTILQFDFAAGTEANAMEVSAGGTSYLGNALGAIAKDAMSITMADTTGIAAGDALYIEQDNTQSYLDANGWTNVSWSDADTRPFREAIAEVDHVDGNTVYLKQPIAYDMDDGQAEVYAIDLLHGLSFSDFTITYGLGTPNPYDFANTLPDYMGTAALRITGTAGADLSGISIVNAASHGFDIRSSVGVTADDLLVSGAHNKGPSGNGYGVQIYETFASTFSNLDIFDTRHAVLFSSWHAEAYNSVHIASTNRDVNFHGSPDTDNHVTVSSAILDYDPSQNTGPDNGYWSPVNHGGSTHAETDIWNFNTVVFDHAEGFDRGDTIYGGDNGAYLNGKEGQDTIFGGAGDDTIVGGGNKDTLQGGDGADTFVFWLGGNYDRVTDFNPAEGDRLVFAGSPDAASFADLVLTQDGTDAYLRFGSNATVILEGHDIATLDGTGMIFDPDGTTWAPVYLGSDFIA